MDFKIDKAILLQNLPMEFNNVEIIKTIGNSFGIFRRIIENEINQAKIIIVVEMNYHTKYIPPIQLCFNLNSIIINPKILEDYIENMRLGNLANPSVQITHYDDKPCIDNAVKVKFMKDRGGFYLGPSPLSSKEISSPKLTDNNYINSQPLAASVDSDLPHLRVRGGANFGYH